MNVHQVTGPSIPAQTGAATAPDSADAGTTSDDDTTGGAGEADVSSAEWGTRMAAVEELATVGSWSWRVDGVDAWWSPMIYRILDVDPEVVDLTWPSFLDLVHADDRAALEDRMSGLIAAPAPYTIDFRIVRADGSVRELRTAGRVDAGDDPSTVRVVGTIQDVTTERAAIAALRRSRDLFAGVLNAATEQAIIATDLDGIVSVFNTGAEKMLGWTAAEMIGRTTERIHDPVEMATLAGRLGIPPGLPAFLRSVARSSPQTLRCTYVTRHGDRRQVMLTVNEMTTPDGTPSGYIKIATDVTDQILAQAVLDGETRFRNTFVYAPNGMMLIEIGRERPGRLIQVNPALCALTGHDEATLLGKDIYDLAVGDHRLDLETHLGEMRAGRTTGVSLEHRWLDARGHDLWVQFNMSPLASDRDHYVVAQVENITARKNAEEHLTHQALHDNLTGLPNRLLLMDRITHALAAAHRSRLGVGVLYLDLDGFKAINDSAGHAIGDLALRQVADRLRASFRPGDTVARLGGDEFVAVLPDIDVIDTATDIAERVLAVLREPFSLAGHSYLLAASIGVSLSTDDSSPDQMLHDADQAMYAAKTDGKGRIRVGFGNDPELASRAARAARTIRLETELVRAIDRHELVMYGQPVVDLQSGRTDAVENLVRWQHPRRGLLGPVEFLDVAENSALIMPLGRRVLHESCRMAADWFDVLGEAAPSVHVNISGRQLESGHLREDVTTALERYRLPAHKLVLELTETHMPLLADSLKRDIMQLREAGIRLAIDDLGTGYSSLARITELPVDILKIDISFVRSMASDPACAAVVRGILAIGAELGLEVIAEGVETADQAAQLQDWGCSGVQGWFYGRPMPETVLARTLGVTAGG